MRSFAGESFLETTCYVWEARLPIGAGVAVHVARPVMLPPDRLQGLWLAGRRVLLRGLIGGEMPVVDVPWPLEASRCQMGRQTSNWNIVVEMVTLMPPIAIWSRCWEPLGVTTIWMVQMLQRTFVIELEPHALDPLMALMSRPRVSLGARVRFGLRTAESRRR